MKKLILVFLNIFLIDTMIAIEKESLIAMLTPTIMQQLPHHTFNYEFPSHSHTFADNTIHSLMLSNHDNTLSITSVTLNQETLEFLKKSYSIHLSQPRILLKKNLTLYPETDHYHTCEVRHHDEVEEYKEPHENFLYTSKDFLRFNIKNITIYSQEHDTLPTVIHGAIDYGSNTIKGMHGMKGLLLVAIKKLTLEWYPIPITA